MTSLRILGCWKRLKLEEEKDGESVDNGINDDSTRPWSDLPPELLSLIANRLGIIELLGFRGVCNGWRRASSSASAEIESEVGKDPSFLAYSDNDKKSFLYYRPNGKLYSMNIPEFEKSTCIASYQGWLILFDGDRSMYLFCPFSRARIELPQLPDDSKLYKPVAALSAPPTSPECVITVVNQFHHASLEVYLLNPGADVWIKHEMKSHKDVGDIVGSLYCQEESSFYLIGSKSYVVRFSVTEKKFYPYHIVHQRESPNCDYLPFGYDVDYFIRSGMRKCIGLPDDASISTWGTLKPGKSCDYYIHNETVKALKGQANSQLKGIWIQARFFRVPPTQRWSL